MDIYIIKDGTVVEYLTNSIYDTRLPELPILPPEVDLVELNWVAKDQVVSQ